MRLEELPGHPVILSKPFFVQGPARLAMLGKRWDPEHP